jgi:hypothetical protein
MSFIKRAQEAAQAAAEQATARGGLASKQASDPRPRRNSVNRRVRRWALPAAAVSTVVERIDPSVLADLIIKSTALQEMTNSSLREKPVAVPGSPR